MDNIDDTLTRDKLATQLRQQVGITHTDAMAIVESFFTAIAKSVERNDSVSLKNFGKFEVKERPPRTGRNPRTGKSVPVPARRTVLFRPSKALYAQIAKYAGPGIE